MLNTLRLALLASPTTLGVTAGAVALGRVDHDLGMGATDGSVLVVFTIGVALGAPLGGTLERIYGERVALTVATVAALIGALLVLTAFTELPLLIGRLLLGLGSGSLATLAFIGAAHHDRPTSAIAVVSAAMNGLAGAGALLGAVLTAAVGWRLTLVLPALAVVVVPDALRAAPSPTPRVATRRLDRVGMVLLGVTVVSAVMALDAASVQIPTAVMLAVLGLAVLAGALLSWWSRHKASHGYLRVRAFGDRDFRRALATGPFFMAANFSTLFLVPLLLGRSGVTAVHVGLVALPATAVAIVSGVAAARVHRRGRSHTAIGVGGLTILVVAVAATTGQDLLYGAAVAAVLGATAVSQGTLTATGIRALRPEDRSAALGIFNLALQVGGAAGVALVALVAAGSTDLALLLSGAFGLLGGGFGFALIRPGIAPEPNETVALHPAPDAPTRRGDLAASH